jgi:uncharacterized protein YfiM (DUF2279 family)
MKTAESNVAQEVGFAKLLWQDLSERALVTLREVLRRHHLSVLGGDILRIDGAWYVTHSGLLKLANRHHCLGINTRPLLKSCDAASSRWVFKATIFKSPKCRGFTGYGDADPSNVSPLVHGAEMRVAETRAVNRALRKAYGIGICSAEEIGSCAGAVQSRSGGRGESRKLPCQPVTGNAGNASNGHDSNGNGSRVRDRLCQVIRQHGLDGELVKTYAVDFCGTKTLREANREQVEKFVAHLAEWAAQDRNALLCKLNSYLPRREGAA